MCQEVAREIPPPPSHSLPPDKNSNICYSVQFSRKLRFDHMMCQEVAREIPPPPSHSLPPDKNSNICYSVQFSRKLRFVTGSYDVPGGGTRILFYLLPSVDLPPHLLPFPSSSVDLVDQACRSCNCRGLSRPQLPISSGEAAVAAAAAASTRILGIPRSSSFLDQRATGGSDVDVAIKPAKIGQ
ncbi:LOW QUALITY PROTEIN: hypothetical protein V1477_008366 [Vespula maculifrons]|uniref:Uncharacterized protein n=1 Tax=Vespula maculifrons TaxID=7453 RepID=A0ABD2CCV1_VESMC